ncbi:single-stranded DNA-binding protein [Georgenia sp. MJ206]|uniref:single-stranded DNA-binding protein n=1 Tax=Georgenia wangjunii TaxID=3117730 RepID=UPI002F26516D
MDVKSQVTVRGNVGATPTLVISERGTRYTRFRIAVTQRVKDAATGQWRDGRTEWFTVKTWYDLAENVAASLVKGTPVVVVGTLSTDTWTRDGQEQTTLVIHADVVGIDLKTGTAHFSRVVRGVRLEEEEPLGHADPVPGTAPDADAPVWELPPDDEPAGEEYGDEPEGAALTGATTS